ncbi:MAG: TetR/AcrR family transcriptional regulator [Nannocystaceae bacterium]|nr:TetR/AcrR family transcriptional regulator [Nannocystaceae bacterium]
MSPRNRKPYEPQQARSRFLADAVLEAAERVIQDTGWAGAKVARIAKVAGVSVGSMYRYFPGRDVLLGAVIDRRLARDHDAFLRAIDAARGETVEQSLEAFTDALLADRQLTHPKLLRHLVGVVDAVGRLCAVQETFDDMIRQFARHMAQQHPELGPMELVERRCHMVFWGMRGAFVARARVEDPFDLQQFRDDAMLMAHAMLRAGHEADTR